MKTRDLYMFILTAILCGAFSCADVQAKVCFAADDGCNSGLSFKSTDFKEYNEDACKSSGYTESACGEDDLTYLCPYNSKWMKCCNKSYHYDACIYPLESAGTCGGRAKCVCPTEYKITAEMAESQRCQPADYCTLNDGESTTTYYKTCTCAKDVYTDVSSCKNNQTESSSCTDSDGVVRKKCYCDRSVYPMSSCEYGGKNGSCIDSNTGREYYKSCRSSAEACEADGYYNNCTSQKTSGTTSAATCSGTGSGSYACENGAQCSYNNEYYKCVFSIKGYCVGNGYTEEDTVKNTNGSCYDANGVQGTKAYCSKGPTAEGKYYYKCAVTCSDQIKAAISKGELALNTKVVDPNGNYAVERSDSKGKHLYLRGDFGLPKKSLGSNIKWANDSIAGTEYVSVNGYHALYDFDSTKYSACNNSRDAEKMPSLYISHKWMTDTNYLFDVDMSDLNIYFVMNSGDGDGSEYYEITKNHKWKNLTFYEQDVDTSKLKTLGLTADSGEMRESSKKTDWDGVIYDGNRSKIHLDSNVTIEMTGFANFYIGGRFFTNYKDNVENYYGYQSYVDFHFGSHAQFVFNKATIYSYTGADWDGADHSTMIFKDSTGTMGKVWSQFNIGLLNSDIAFTTIHIDGWNNSNANLSLGGTFNSSVCKYTPGVYLKNSRIRIGRGNPFAMVLRNDDASARLYISEDSQVLLYGPIVMNKNVAVCFPEALSGNVYGYTPKTSGNYSGYRFINSSGSAIAPNVKETTTTGYKTRYYRAKGGNGCAPLNVGRCKSGEWANFTTMGAMYVSTDNSGNWGDGGKGNYQPSESNGTLNTACYNFSYCGLGYESYSF